MQDYDSVESLSSSPVESEDPQFRVLSPEPPRPCPVQPLVLDVPSRVDSPPLSPQFDSLREDPRINCVAPQPLRPPFVFEDEFQPHLNELDALLADLQNTVTAPGSNHGPRERNLRSNDYATVNSHADQNNKKVQRSSSFNNAQPQSVSTTRFPLFLIDWKKKKFYYTFLNFQSRLNRVVLIKI
nr:PREDICTED: uncharacterized protein LOC109040231 [Bemisia tabaci]